MALKWEGATVKQVIRGSAQGWSEAVSDETYDKQHVGGCRKLMYDPQSSPCTCQLEFERLATELAALKRTREENHDPITEDWLRDVGFRWHQFDRQPSKHWLLWGTIYLTPSSNRV